RGQGLDDCLSGGVSLTVSALNGEFYVVFGLEEAFYGVGQGNCSAICFYDNGGNIAVKVANMEGETETAVKTLSAVLGYGDGITLSFTVKADGKISLSVNGTNYVNFDNTTACYAAGYFGFAQSAGSAVRITSANVYSAVYDSPVNAQVDETFDDGEFDASRIFTDNNESAVGYYTPEGVSCEDGVLKFNNITSYGFVSTCYEFSNFLMTFDIPHLQREFVRDGNGNVIVPASNFLGVSVGAPQKNVAHYAITQAVFFYFMPVYANGRTTGMTVVVLDNYKIVSQRGIEGENDFFSADNAYDIFGKEKTINMKVEMLDGVLSCCFKWANENESKFRVLLSVDLGYTPLGYVQIHGQGYNASDIVKNDSLPCSNFWIDNLKVANRDADPKTENPEYLSNLMQRGEDYDYIDTWNYRIKTVEAVDADGGSGCGSGIGAGGASFIAAVALAWATAFRVRRKKNEK
ncbi:MAG: hypothetical protein J6Y43_07090, partial [Clostridia bacterium]|nr:hypothetical protein [Clostridia bacterium]